MTEVATVRLITKELEALMWGLAQICDIPHRIPTDEQDPLQVLLNLGHPREKIMDACTELLEAVYMKQLSEPLSPLDKEILRVCIESSSWVRAYMKLGPAGGTANDCRRVLRELAAKFEQSFGIECNFIAND